ncbi:ROK family protein [Dyadobacter luticola]|uniref:ROK family protein n=1 Tax=Dyadobacter luticola TaxID=1979387 RepID=A0A5R9L455_9BACT|nr:ROK family protein [Dyadobacter luticola]TLV03333.1 ROK family protein [Dyadobacter luticola]
MTEPNYLSIEIGGTKLQLIIYSRSGEIVKHWRIAINQEEGSEGILKHIQQVHSEIPGDVALSGVGVGFGGPVDIVTGQIGVSHQISGWKGFGLGDWLRNLFGVPVKIDNDANVAALGEAHHGAGKGQETVFYVTLGSGAGGGLVQNGKLYHGRQPGEAEIGHLRLSPTATFESLCSGWAVDRQIRAAVMQNPGSHLATLSHAAHGFGGEARHLLPAHAAGCEIATEIIDQLAMNVAWGLSHVTHLFHPDVLIIGGGLSHLGATLQEKVSERLEGFVMKAFLPAPKVELAFLGEMVVPVGALALISN